jgi:hypothetical protein
MVWKSLSLLPDGLEILPWKIQYPHIGLRPTHVSVCEACNFLVLVCSLSSHRHSYTESS